MKHEEGEEMCCTHMHDNELIKTLPIRSCRDHVCDRSY